MTMWALHLHLDDATHSARSNAPTPAAKSGWGRELFAVFRDNVRLPIVALLFLEIELMDLNLTLRKLGYVPVAVIDHVEDAVPLAEALIEGGVNSIEVTLRTGAGLASIKAIAKSGLPILVGVGTVTLADQVAQCVDAGAKFAVCPGFTHAVGTACLKASLPLLPGAVTPSEVLTCLDAGFSVQKFFPATVFGGAAWLKMIEAPIPQVNFCATGVAANEIPAVLACNNIAAIGSSAVATREMVAAKNWSLITENAKKMMALVRASRTL